MLDGEAAVGPLAFVRSQIAYVRNRRVRVTDGIVDIEPGRGTMPAHWRPEGATP